MLQVRKIVMSIYLWCILVIVPNPFDLGASSGAVFAWTTDILPKFLIKYDQKRPVFFGNQSDYFQLLDQDDESILIGARNAMYNISLKNLIENRAERLEWKSSDAHRELCSLKGKQESDCQNYIRVFARIDEHKVMVCGTNSYKPLCRYYKNSNGGTLSNSNIVQENEAMEAEPIIIAASESNMVPVSSSTDTEMLADTAAAVTPSESHPGYEMIDEIDGQGRCPYNPTHNSSYIFTDGQLYSATAADFSGGDALIYRDTQRTEQFNAKQLNQPAFVSTVERNGYVFFFFREIALENCGKAIYSRVARVCKNDRGGQSPFRERWTSYLKTRLNCSTPGDFPFYFDELQGTTSIIDGLYQAAVNQKRQLRNYHTTSRTDGTNKNPEMRPSSLIYAVFTTPQNAIPGSAVCAFQVDDIIETFEGDFKGQRDATSSWLPIPASEVPEPRPGKCVDDSRELPMRTVNFVIKMNTLMASSVPALYGQPLLTRVSSKHRFTSITTDAQVEALNGDRYDILFVGTDNGRVIKFINYLRTQTNENSTESNKLHDQQPVANLETVVITETQALPHSVPVKQMVVAKDQQSLIVVSTGNIISIPLSHCSRILRCRDCLNLQDPYCVWDVKNHECTSMSSVNEQNRMNFIQNLRLTINSSDICKRSGDDNYVDVAPSAKPSSANGRSLSIQPGSGVGTNSISENSPHTPASTRGTVSSVGHIAPVLSSNDVTSNSVTNRANEISGSSIESNQIPPNFDAFGNDIENGELGIVEPRNLDAQTSVSASAKNDQMTAMATPIFSCVVFIVFIVGLAVGLIVRRLKFSHSPFDILRNGAGGGHHHLSEQHRNQLNYYDKTNRGLSAVRNTSGGNGKDINLLMNVMGPYIAAGGGNNANSRSSCTTAQTPNNLNKKDILELEFETKDRSHECKNSTEHLDMNDLKANANNNANNNSNCNNTSSNAPTAVIVNTTNTGTLQKVKKTYL